MKATLYSFYKAHRNHINIALILLTAMLWHLYIASTKDISIGVFDDSGSNFTAALNIINGNIDFLRTPLYPLICNLATWISATYAFKLIVALQMLFFIASVITTYYSALITTNSRKIAIFCTSLYTFCPIIFNYCYMIITESLAISLTSFFICAIAYTIKGKHKTIAGAAISIILFIMIMLRPFFVCFVPSAIIAIAYSIHKNKLNKKHIISLNSALCALFMGCIFYCSAYYNSYGKFSFSCVYELNRNMALHKMKLIDHYEGIDTLTYQSSPDINGNTLSINQSWAWNPSKKHLEECNKVYSENKIKYLKHKILEFISTSQTSYSVNFRENPFLYYISIATILYMDYIYLLILIFCVIELYLFIKKNQNIIFSFALFGIVSGTIFTSIWGAYEQYDRLMMPMIPALFSMLAITCGRLSFSIKNHI